MESLFTMIGCILSFLVGAYIRQPFQLKKELQKEVKTVELTDEEKLIEQKKAEQWKEILEYTG